LADFNAVVLQSPIVDLVKLVFLRYKSNWVEVVNLPYWVISNSVYTLQLYKINFFRNTIFSLRIFNYYWNDYLSINSKTMANCAKINLYKNFIY
jgi:hypothetical protein